MSRNKTPVSLCDGLCHLVLFRSSQLNFSGQLITATHALGVPFKRSFGLSGQGDPGSPRLTEILIVEVPEIYVIHHPDGYNREGKDLGPRFQVPGDYPIGSSKRHMGMKLTLNHV